MVKVNRTMQSLNVIENMADFISKDSDRYAQIQVNRFFEITRILKANPEVGRIIPELDNHLIREIITGNYRIIY